MVRILIWMIHLLGYSVLIEENYEYATMSNRMNISARKNAKYGLSIDFGEKRPARLRAWLYKVRGLMAVLKKVREVEKMTPSAA